MSQTSSQPAVISAIDDGCDAIIAVAIQSLSTMINTALRIHKHFIYEGFKPFNQIIHVDLN